MAKVQAAAQIREGVEGDGKGAPYGVCWGFRVLQWLGFRVSKGCKVYYNGLYQDLERIFRRNTGLIRATRYYKPVV